MPNSFRSILTFLVVVTLVGSGASGQGGKGKGGPQKPGDDGTKAENAPVKVNVGATPKGVDDAIKKNEEKVKKEAEKISSQIGGEYRGAQGPNIALYCEEPLDRIQQLVRISESMLSELAADLQVDTFVDLWAKRMGPFNFYYFKSKSTFGDAYREYLEKRFPSHNLGRARSNYLDTGRFIQEMPSPLAAGEVTDYEATLSHQIGQTVLLFAMRIGPPFPAATPAPKAPETGGDGEEAPPSPPPSDGAPKPLPKKDKDEALEGEEISWLMEGFAMYASVRFVGANRMYCITDTKYVGNIAVADKNRDTAYRLISLEVAQGAEDKAKDFALLTRTDTNALSFIDLAKSWSFFDWMMRSENRQKLVAVMKGMRGPRSFAASLKKNAGWSLSDLEENWKKFVLAEYGGGNKKKGGTTPDPKAKDPKAKDPKPKK